MKLLLVVFSMHLKDVICAYAALEMGTSRNLGKIKFGQYLSAVFQILLYFTLFLSYDD